MRRKPALTLSVLALTLAFGVAGCSSDSPAAPELDASAASGPTISGDGYSYSVPEGWEEQDSSLAPGSDTVAIDLAATGDFANNINVIPSPSGAFDADEVEETVVAELEDAGASNVEVLDRLTIAEAESAHISADMSLEGVEYRVHQYYLTNDDQTYVVTFSYNVDESDEDAVEIAESVLASWSWS
ncbi:MAG TPA: hypothetical protein VGP24_18055 [Glaciihabitans sp.]|jgi:hypothetical protein|nr:hypothetical protein [Glaciihabitans sp.]